MSEQLDAPAAPKGNLFNVEVVGVSREMRDDLIFKIRVETNLPEYSNTSYNVERSFTEVEKLHSYLADRKDGHLPSPAPPITIKDETLAKLTVLRFLKRTFEHEVFRIDDGVKPFIESKFGYSPSSLSPNARRKLRVKSSSREVDAFFDAFSLSIERHLNFVGDMGKCGKKVGDLIDLIGKASADVGEKLGFLNLLESAFLSRMLGKLSKTLVSVEGLSCAQSAAYADAFRSFCDSLLDSASSVSMALSYRQSMLASYEKACKTTQRKIDSMDKLRGQSLIKGDKVDIAIAELNDSKAVESATRDSYKKLNAVLRAEIIIWQEYVVEDVDGFLESYVHKQIDMEKGMLALWKTFEHEINF